MSLRLYGFFAFAEPSASIPTVPLDGIGHLHDEAFVSQMQLNSLGVVQWEGLKRLLAGVGGIVGEE